MAKIPAAPLHEAIEQLGEALMTDDHDQCRALVQLAHDRIQEALEAGGAWPPPADDAWVAICAACGHENIFPSKPGNLMTSECTNCRALLGGVKVKQRASKTAGV